jgi:hypothetical protein
MYSPEESKIDYSDLEDLIAGRKPVDVFTATACYTVLFTAVVIVIGFILWIFI